MNEIITIPLQVSQTEYILVIAIPKISIQRIQKHDPIVIPITKIINEHFTRLILKEVHITHYDDQDDKKIQAIIREHRDPMEAIKLLTRGWSYRPDLGDNDLPPRELKPVN